MRMIRVATIRPMGFRALRVEAGGTTIDLARDGEYRIGRVPDADLVVDDPRVSREHLFVHGSAGRWSVEDRHSSSGTYLDGRRIDRVVVDRPLTLRLAGPDGPAVSFEPAPAVAADHHPPARRPTGVFRSTRTMSRPLHIGRAVDNDIVVDDPLVSRRHAVLRPTGDGLEIEDLRSHNGTFVNGRRISVEAVTERDMVGIGRHQFRLVDGRLEEFADTGSITFGVSEVVLETAGGHRLVDDVSFTLPEHSLLAIVGPSGCGKSSLLGVLSGLRSPTSGHVLYENRDLHAESDELLSRVGFVPQDDLLHGGLTVRGSLRFTERLRFSPDLSDAEHGARLDEVLDQLGMTHRAEHRIDQLSGGERKRVNVATELLTRPSLLLLDEPASGLDAGLERTLMVLLRRLADSGHTVIVVTHSLDSLHLCDRVLMLAPGGVPAFVGAPADAAARFGDDDMVETFHRLATEPDRDWRDPDRPRAPDVPAPTGAASSRPDAAAPRRRRPLGEWFRQLGALSARFVAVLAADRRNLALLALQAPVLGVLMLVALPDNELAFPSPTQVRFVSTAGLVLFVVLLGGTWLGANNAIREIARERTLFERERAAGLSVSAYVASKALVLGTLTAVQAAMLVAIATARQGGPEDAVVLGLPTGELMVVVAVAGVASMALALLVSAVVGSPDRATTLLPIVLILQFVLSAGGVLPEIVDKPVLREVSALASAQWGFAAAASTADLNELQAFTDQLRDLREVDAADPAPAIEALTEPARPEPRWAHETGAWLVAVVALLALILGPLAGAGYVLHRRDMAP